jgi:ABC-type branched-subunit amino acid transport system ATPase component
MHKPFYELRLGYVDAQMYTQRQHKNEFNQIFVKNNIPDKICNENVTFVIGDKGTGKTAYAVFVCNNAHMETHGEIKTLSQTDYSKFITLKNNKKIEFSNYASVWKVILLLLMSEHVRATEPKPGLLGKLFKKSNLIHKAIDEYYTNAFSPEIEKAINIAEEANVVAKIIHEYVQAEKKC